MSGEQVLWKLKHTAMIVFGLIKLTQCFLDMASETETDRFLSTYKYVNKLQWKHQYPIRPSFEFKRMWDICLRIERVGDGSWTLFLFKFQEKRHSTEAFSLYTEFQWEYNFTPTLFYPPPGWCACASCGTFIICYDLGVCHSKREKLIELWSNIKIRRTPV